jgi:hypothetical protein
VLVTDVSFPTSSRAAPAPSCLAEAPHNCIGGSEQQCLPPPGQASTMFADPSKMYQPFNPSAPAHWYKGPVSFM